MAEVSPTNPTRPRRRGLLYAELALLVAAALYSLWFYVALPGRLPSDADYHQVGQAIHEGFTVGDAVAVAPEWAERARSLLPGLPFISTPDLAHADFTRVRRLWLIGLPRVPRSNLDRVTAALGAVLQADGAPRTFGRLVLQRYTNAGFHEPRFDFTRDVGRAQVYIELPQQRYACTREGESHRCGNGGPVVRHEVREIEFAPYDCVGANPVGRNLPLVVDYPDALLGSELLVMAGVTGEMGWRHSPGLTPVDLQVEIDGKAVGSIHIPVGTVPPQRTRIDTHAFDGSQPHHVRFLVTTANPESREFCFDAQSQ